MLLALFYRFLRRTESLPDISPQEKYTEIFLPVDRTVHASARINQRYADRRTSGVKHQVRVLGVAAGIRQYTSVAKQF